MFAKRISLLSLHKQKKRAGRVGNCMRIHLAAVQFAHRQVTVYISSDWRDLASNKAEET